MSKSRKITAAGHEKPLICLSLKASCGDVDDGIAFKFDGEGGWVVPIDELKNLVDDAIELRSKPTNGE